MSELLKFLTDFTDQTIIILLCVLILTGWGFVVLWIFNRRRIHKMSHQIPATVVKNYLDSIIQNSSSLKSSLFRGAGGDIVPSVMPVENLTGGSSIGASSNELNAKNAEISALLARVGEKEKIITDLEARLKEVPAGDGEDNSEELQLLKDEISNLQNQLAAAKEAAAAGGGGGGDEELQGKLAETIKERDELKERLMEYEIIEEDLANLKRLQQENEQLKAQLGGGAAPAAEPPPAAEPEPAAEAAPEPEPEPVEESEPESVAEAASDEEVPEEEVTAAPAAEGEQKSAEELLSEFEKMLG